jgi:hypothetical protein
VPEDYLEVLKQVKTSFMMTELIIFDGDQLANDQFSNLAAYCCAELALKIKKPFDFLWNCIY